MKGVILAGGLGTRLYPLTKVTNKHLLPIFDKPMIFYPINTLVRAGIDEIMVVTGGPHCGDFLGVLKNGNELKIKHLEYAYQENEGGIADALRLAEDFADNGNIAVILGDNTTDFDISSDVANFKEGAMVFLKEVPDPERFGIPVFDKESSEKILEILEKPKDPQNNFAVTGLYIYDNKVFDFIRENKPSERGEMEITDVNNHYARSGNLGYRTIDGFWRDAGTFETLLEANIFWSKKKG
ncbi:spore coat protein [Candidatus Daviesbacteria bacterium RIFCSPHIGHO2_12_FULL_37_11]|uniref:glucose-1-phosphate thymidylyltransferase n=1 Tax=Candidatus Daviesbacteria bacterium RIFCSPHIGHO2_12_FULL_37_11 TaxID=1797777 RepID=A0A1F5KDT5_9BACT|nr:MAG: spore coat protein [Candidatus Daviesbacteria bacterium GWA1_38_6]OGE15831.1 MAG: spore coat protein [Candidatus Daviesbacteria bacterium RIFCSPHIGHO2_01_FULL_37_27]OGE38761.1 MAG: spore coat protein [Candidatus Daviesbacteria bacterium RIFCSPHIGHO2_12_FULL_37_11]OGE44910.1 MAG: spore coat protein [Candidatus Daviesbacteria bacterium RIFCSPLOWO2_01_FULL_37_10]